MAGISYAVNYEIRKSDGKVLQAIYNGQQQQIPDFALEAVSETQTRIMVEADTFEVTYTSHRHPQRTTLETWTASNVVPLDGIAEY